MLRLVLLRLQLDPAARVCDRTFVIARRKALIQDRAARPTVRAREPIAAPVDPLLEALRLRKKEAGEKLAVITLERALPILALNAVFEIVRIDLDVVRDAHSIRLRLQPVLAQHLT